MRPRTFGVLALLPVVIAGCGSGSGHTSSPAAVSPGANRTVAPGSTTASPTVGCQKVAAPTPKGAQHLSAPTLRLDAKRTYTARMLTSCGEIDIRLDVRRAPRTTASFVYLARRGFYDSLTFHRIAPGFVIQGGDPLGNGQGGPGYTVVEPPPAGQTYTHGVVAMAKTGTDPRGASGSQFYIVSGADAGLPPGLCAAGACGGRRRGGRRHRRRAQQRPARQHAAVPVVIDRVTITVSR